MLRIALLLLLLLPTVSFAESFQTIKVLAINSYYSNHICTGPQEAGFYEYLEEFVDETPGYGFVFHGVDMFTKTKNIQHEQIQCVADQILSRIKKFNPDYIFITDDNAFKYIAIPASRQKYKIIFSGLNKPYDEYKLEYNLNDLCFAGVNETISLKPLFTLFNEVGFVPSKYYLFVEHSGNSHKSLTDKLLTKSYIRDLALKKIKPTIIQIRDRRQFERVIKELNQKDDHFVVLLPIQKLYDPDTLTIHDKKGIIQILTRVNKKQLYVGENTYFCKYGLPLACSQSFYDMGQLSGQILIQSILTKTFKHIVYTPENIISVNIKRLKQLKLQSLYRYSGVNRIQYSEY